MAKARQDVESKKIMAQDDKAPKRIQNILEFLNLLLPMTLAKRLVNMILIVAGVPIALKWSPCQGPKSGKDVLWSEIKN